MRYGHAIRKLRKLRGLSQRDLGLAAGLDQSYVSLIERDKRAPSAGVLDDLAKTLRIPVYLIALLGSEEQDLHGISPAEAEALKHELLHAVLTVTGE